MNATIRNFNCFWLLLVIALGSQFSQSANAQAIETILHVTNSSETPQISYDFSPTQWYYIAYTKPIIGQGTMYVNGNPIGEINWDFLSYDHHILNIGASFYITYRDYFEGTIDEIRISSKERTASEIKNYYESSSSFPVDGYTLQLWRFDEGSGEEFYNANNDLTGEVIGEPVWVDGKFDKAIKYDGMDDRLRVNYDMPEFGVTYEFWVKFDGTVKEEKQTIIQPYGAFSIDFTIQQNADAPVVDPAEPQFILATATGAQNNDVTIPVTVKDFNDILTMQGTITWDPALLTFKNTQDFALADLDEDAFYLYEPGKLTYSWSPSDLQPESVADDTEIFSILFEAVGPSSSEAAIVFSDDPTPREVSDGGGRILTTTYMDGKISILGDVVCGGYIRTQKGEAIENVEVFLSGGAESSTMTDETGWYSFNLVPGQEYNIRPELNLDADDAITTLDIVVMHWHILGQKIMMSNFDLIACDVNESNSLTTLDLAETRAIILHTEDQFRQRNAVEFINHLYTGTPDPFDYEKTLTITPDAAHSDLNFTAVKLGDAGRSWKVGNANGRKHQLDEIEIILEPTSFSEHQVSVPLKTGNTMQLVGMQFTLEWDPEVYKFNGIDEGLLAFISNLERVDEGLLTVTWNSEKITGMIVDENSVLSNLKFEVLADNEDSKLNITSGLTPAFAYNSSLESLHVKSRFYEELKATRLSIFPNPATESIHFTFNGEQYPTEYSILSTTGKIVSLGKLNGKNNINVSSLRSGIYFLQVADNNNQVINRKFIKQ